MKKKENNVELRFLPAMEVRADEQGKVTGYGAVFNSWSEDLGGFRERIAPGAFDGVDMENVYITFNHNFDNVLARTKNGTAGLSIDDKGLVYSYQTPNTTTGRDVEELIRTGTIEGSSFMFTVEEQSWNELPDVWERTITRVGRLLELGPVTVPAYPDTTAAVRSMDFAAKQKPKPYDPEVDVFLQTL